MSTSALVRRINGNVNLEASLGRHSLLSKEEESLLVNHLLKMASIGYGYDIANSKCDEKICDNAEK